MVKHTKRDWRMAALVALIILVLGACTLTPGTTTWGDDHAAYINEGISTEKRHRALRCLLVNHPRMAFKSSSGVVVGAML